MSNIFTDPIFPAIKNSKARWATYKSTCDRQPDGPCRGTPEYHTWHSEESRVGGEWEVAFRDMRYACNTTDHARGRIGIDRLLSGDRTRNDR
jgi:hypothetical protein